LPLLCAESTDNKIFKVVKIKGVRMNLCMKLPKGKVSKMTVFYSNTDVTVEEQSTCHISLLPAASIYARYYIQCESKTNPPIGDLTFFHFFHKRLRIFNRFFTHLLNVPIITRLQIFIQLSPILTKLCHIKRDYPVHIICAKCPKRAITRVQTFA